MAGVIEIYGAEPAWSPSQLVNLAPSINVALMRSLGLLWQDAAMTVPAVANGESVAVARCPWTGAYWRAVSVPGSPTLFSEGSGKWSLACGTGLYLNLDAGWTNQWAEAEILAAIAGSPSGDHPLWQWGTGAGNWFPFGADIYEDFGRATRFNFTPVADIRATSLTYGISVSSSALTLRINAVQEYSAGAAAVVFMSSPYVGFSLGSGAYFNGRFRGLVTSSAVLSAPDRALLQTYMAALNP